MSRRFGVFVDRGLRFPRVSGDEPLSVMAFPCPALFSPRERG